MILLRRFLGIFAVGIGILCLAFLLYTLVFSTLPYMLQPKVSSQSKLLLDAKNYYGNGENGPDKITLIENTTEAFNVRIQLVRKAKNTLDIVCHTIGGGETTDALAWEIWQAAQKGVKVRIFLDDKVGLTMEDAQNAIRFLCRHPNIEYRVYNPAKALRPWTLHALLHDKFFLVDDTLLLLGGRNMGDKYFAPASFTGEVTEDRDALVWNTGAEINDSVIKAADEYMNLLWNLPGAKTPKTMSGPAPAKEEDRAHYKMAAQKLRHTDPVFYMQSLQDYLNRTVPTKKISLLCNPVNAGCKEPWVGYQLQRLARRAKDTVLIQMPYATAHPDLLETLTSTARQAKVTMVTNSIVSSPNYPAYSNYLSQRDKFIATGTQIYEFQSKDSIHGKSVVIDNRLSAVGSFNLDDRSFYIDTETMLVVDSEPFAAILTDAIRTYQNQSLLVETGTEESALPVPGGKRVMMFLASLLSRPLRFLI